MASFEHNVNPRIMISCPATQLPVFVGLRALDEPDFEQMRRNGFSGPPAACSHCGSQHAWKADTTFLEPPIAVGASSAACCFVLLQGDEHSRGFVEAASRTIAFISKFMDKTSAAFAEHSRILCIGAADGDTDVASLKRIETKWQLEVLTPADRGALMSDPDSYYGHRIVWSFHLANLKANGKILILIEPGRMIESAAELSKAIKTVAQNSDTLAVSYRKNIAPLPIAAVVASSSLQGATTTAAMGYGISYGQPLFGRTKFTRHTRGGPRSPKPPDNFDSQWLIGAVSYHFQEHPQRTVEFIDWAI